MTTHNSKDSSIRPGMETMKVGGCDPFTIVRSPIPKNCRVYLSTQTIVLKRTLSDSQECRVLSVVRNGIRRRLRRPIPLVALTCD